MDPDFLSRIIGQKLKITLSCGSFEGILHNVDPQKVIHLSKVKDLESGRNLPGIKLFFGHEIENVELANDSGGGSTGETTEVPSTNRKIAWRIFHDPSTSHKPSTSKFHQKEEIDMLNSCIPSPEIAEKEKVSPTGKSEWPASAPAEPLNTTWNSFRHDIAGREVDVEYIVIDQFQHKFGPAIGHLKNQCVLGIAAEGVTVCRHGKLCWLQVATKGRVYLFDIFTLGMRAFKNGLQMIFEDKGILKVIHDCRWLSDCLSHQYGIVLTNIFDTQVADVFNFSKQTGGYLPHCISSLEDSLVRHLGISPSEIDLLRCRQQLIQGERDIWFIRPAPPHLLKFLALEAVFLLPLRSVLLDEMMSDFTSLVDVYLNAYRHGEPDLLGSIEFSCMELPDELHQLTDWQKLRREKALAEYELNPNGLLIRPVNIRLSRTSSYKSSKCDSQGAVEDSRKQNIKGGSPSLETSRPASDEKSQPEEEKWLPKWEEPADKGEGLSLKELKMMVLGMESGLSCMKPGYSLETSSFQALKKPVPPSLSPCPSLE